VTGVTDEVRGVVPTSNPESNAAVIALLGERPPTRSQLASLLSADADDPLRALRWSLAEVRRALDDHGSVDARLRVCRYCPETAASST
jgi:hypothetical protein